LNHHPSFHAFFANFIFNTHVLAYIQKHFGQIVEH